jgi:glycosyltransferase involved in cell wall biosynthesis
MITYNHVPFIAQAIEGVLQQKTDFPVELVIGEDCSTDGTREIVFEYQKKHPDIIRVVTSDKNVGMIKNGLRTVKACQGKYIAFCEGDDYWQSPHKLQKQVEYMESHPDCGLICSDYDVLYVGVGKRIQKWNKKDGKNPSQITDVKYIIRGTPTSGILTCTVMTRKDLILNVLDSDPFLYQNEKQPCGDTPIWTGISRLGSIAYIDESLSTYTRHTESATRSSDITKVLRTSISMKEQMLYLIEKYDLPNAERTKHIGDLWRRKLKLAFYEKNSEMAAESKRYLQKLSAVEWLQFWGARSNYLNGAFRPILKLICRNAIPTAK